MKGKGDLNLELSESSQYIVIRISDSGQGITPTNIKRIFNPGFTTKQRGWGLGLSLVKRIIVDYHQGTVEVLKSEIGQGTTFEIRLKKLK